MINKNDSPDNVDDYIAQFSVEIQEKLTKIREIIKKAAPNAIEKMSYQMPTYVFYGILMHFGAFKNHIGFYPKSSSITQFEEELSTFKRGKGSVVFPFDKPIPYDLIEKIVKFRAKENQVRNKN